MNYDYIIFNAVGNSFVSLFNFVNFYYLLKFLELSYYSPASKSH